MPAPPTAEVFFLDVGQGTSNIILLGDRRAIVIDGGPLGVGSGVQNKHSLVALQLLHHYVDEIVALIASHNDDDHVRGVQRILEAYEGRIRDVWILQDRPAKDIGLFYALRRQIAEESLGRDHVHFLSCDGTPRLVFLDPARKISLEVVAPAPIDNVAAQLAASPNATSAILRFSCGQRRIVFPGDATISEWRALSQRLGHALACDLLAVPHHAGALESRKSGAQSSGDLRWLYQKGVLCSYAVVSVGTCNIHKHPLEEHIGEILASGATVLCTQITKKCHNSLEELRPGVIPPSVPSSSSRTGDFTSGGNSRNVACASTVTVVLSEDDVMIARLDEHQRGIDDLVRHGGHPLCRSASFSGNRSTSCSVDTVERKEGEEDLC